MAAEQLIVHCTDHRFVHETVHFAKALGLLDRYEDVGVAGAVKNLVDPYDPKDPEFILRQIEIAKKLHRISQVVLINHLDCDAYGQGTFATPAEERERHLRDLRAAKGLVEKRFDGLDVLTVLARLNADRKIDFEKVV